MAQTETDRKTFQAYSRQEWREWLSRNHATEQGVWLISYKKAAGKPGVSYPEAVEEALCFGWIDSRRNALDDERSIQYFCPRKPRSPWSTLNKQRIARLITDGVMTPAGMAKIETAKRDGSWEVYDAIEALTVPDDLAAALTADAATRETFDAFAPSIKKQILYWIATAKRPETRAKRIEESVRAAAEGRNPVVYTRRSRA